MNILIHVSVCTYEWIFIGYIPRGGVWGLYKMHILDYTRDHWITFPKGYTNLFSHKFSFCKISVLQHQLLAIWALTSREDALCCRACQGLCLKASEIYMYLFKGRDTSLLGCKWFPFLRHNFLTTSHNGCSVFKVYELLVFLN